MNWLPIESAPRDETSVLLSCEDGEQVVGYWDFYYAEGGSSYDGGTAWVAVCGGERVDLHFGAPTHWMPLPDGPK